MYNTLFYHHRGWASSITGFGIAGFVCQLRDTRVAGKKSIADIDVTYFTLQKKYYYFSP